MPASAFRGNTKYFSQSLKNGNWAFRRSKAQLPLPFRFVFCQFPFHALNLFGRVGANY